MFNMIFVIA